MTTKIIETGKGNDDVPTLKRRIELRKTKIYYAKLYDNGSEAVYLFPMFDKVVYVRVRYREKNGQKHICLDTRPYT